MTEADNRTEKESGIERIARIVHAVIKTKCFPMRMGAEYYVDTNSTGCELRDYS